MSPWTFEAALDQNEELIQQANATNIRFVTPAIHTFQIEGSGSTIYGYAIDDPRARSGHFVHAWDPFEPQVVQATIARLACHFLVDLTPASGLEEVLEKTNEIREYYGSLEGWRSPVIAAEVSVAVNPEVESYVRDSFTLSGE